MNLIEYLRIIVRRGWIVVLAALLTAGSGFVFSRLQTPVYRATQKILIKPARNDFGLTQTLKQLIQSWAARMDTELRAQEVISVTKSDLTPGALAGMVGITPNLNELQLVIDVDMADPSQAVLIAREYGEQFRSWREQENQPLRLEDRINAELLDTPQSSLYRPNTTINVAAGGLLGVLIGAMIVFALEFLDTNILRRATEIERQLQLPLLAIIPE